MNIYIEYFESQNDNRKKEIIESIKHNISFNFINNYYIFSSAFSWLNLKDERIHQIKIIDRCTFGYIFNFANSVSNKENINILINNDITLTESFESINIDDSTFYCITRYENETDKNPVSIKGWGQDTWVWKGKNMIPLDKVNFYMGILGCDNRLAYEASLVYSNVNNPAYKYKTIHNHKSNIRTYNKKSKIKGPYKLIKPE